MFNFFRPIFPFSLCFMKTIILLFHAFFFLYKYFFPNFTLVIVSKYFVMLSILNTWSFVRLIDYFYFYGIDYKQEKHVLQLNTRFRFVSRVQYLVYSFLLSNSILLTICFKHVFNLLFAAVIRSCRFSKIIFPFKRFTVTLQMCEKMI